MQFKTTYLIFLDTNFFQYRMSKDFDIIFPKKEIKNKLKRQNL